MSVQAIFSTTVLAAGENEELITKSTQGKLVDWLEYKRENLPELIDNVVSSDEWNLPE
ncbi:hypothetical protein [Halorussus caseinilyticus]